MAENNKDIVEIKNDSGIIIYPVTTGEAVYVSTGETLQEFLNGLRTALKYNIIPETDQTVSFGNSSKQIKAIYVAKIIVSDTIETSNIKATYGDFTTAKAETVNAETVNATKQINGNVNWDGVAEAGTYKVWGAVAN